MNLFDGEEAEKFGAHTAGVRPEHIDVVSPEEGYWTGTVGVAEHLGSDTFFHIHETGLAETITVRAPGDVDFKHGDKIGLNPRTDLIHKFNQQQERIQ
jgi:multiple sugar transport system ATP-binding protein